MASDLTIQTIRGPGSGANANKIIIPAGQTLDISSGTLIPSAGAIVGVASAQNSSASTGSSSTTINTISYIPKYNSGSSKLIITSVWFHGIGPANTNLDGWGNKFRTTINGTTLGIEIIHDVFPGGFTVSYGYGPEWYVNCVTSIRDSSVNSISYTAGTPITINQYINVDVSSNYWMLNRCYAANVVRATSSLLVQEVKL